MTCRDAGILILWLTVLLPLTWQVQELQSEIPADWVQILPLPLYTQAAGLVSHSA